MSDLDDLDLDKSTDEHALDERDRESGRARDFIWIAVAAGLLVLAILVAYFSLRRQPPAEAPRQV